MIDVRGRYLKTLLERSLQFGTIQVTGDTGNGDELADELSVWLYHIEG